MNSNAQQQDVQIGVILGLAYFGSTARATCSSDRLFNYPSVLADSDPANPEFKCVLNTSAVIVGEPSFAALFVEAQFVPLFFISLAAS